MHICMIRINNMVLIERVDYLNLILNLAQKTGIIICFFKGIYKKVVKK